MVTWVNESGAGVSINSDPHPTHTDYAPLNLGEVADAGSVSLSFPKAGVYKYHDHYHPKVKGTITVE